MTLRTCNIVETNCDRPAAFRAGGGMAEVDASDMTGPIRTCHSCGEDVCEKCSKLVLKLVKSRRCRRLCYVRRFVRLCNTCLES